MQNLTHRSDVANRLRGIELGDNDSELARRGERCLRLRKTSAIPLEGCWLKGRYRWVSGGWSASGFRRSLTTPMTVHHVSPLSLKRKGVPTGSSSANLSEKRPHEAIRPSGPKCYSSDL